MVIRYRCKKICIFQSYDWNLQIFCYIEKTKIMVK